MNEAQRRVRQHRQERAAARRKLADAPAARGGNTEEAQTQKDSDGRLGRDDSSAE